MTLVSGKLAAYFSVRHLKIAAICVEATTAKFQFTLRLLLAAMNDELRSYRWRID